MMLYAFIKFKKQQVMRTVDGNILEKIKNLATGKENNIFISLIKTKI